MPVTHTNRLGHVYYLHEGVTKSGTPRYHFSRKPGDDMPAEIPAGYAIYEKPETSQVYLRKPPKSRILREERDLAESLAREAAGTRLILVDIEGDSLMLYHAEIDYGTIERLTGQTFGFAPLSPRLQDAIEIFEQQARYMKALQFTLTDEKSRLFQSSRWHYTREFWSPLAQGTLDEIVPKLAQHLGRDSFYQLM